MRTAGCQQPPPTATLSRRSLHLDLYRDKGAAWLFQFVLVWPLLDVVRTGMNSFPLAALLQEQRHSPHLQAQLEALGGRAVLTQEAYSKNSKQNKTHAPALPASSSQMLCLPKAVTSSLQRCFPDVIRGSELTPCKSTMAPGTQTAAYQPFLSTHKFLPLLFDSVTS